MVPPRPFRRPSTLARAGGVLLGLAALAGCLDPVRENRPLSLTLSVDRNTATVADSVEFFFEAEGNGLAGVILSFGDGTFEQVPTSFSSTASARIRHAYDSVGRFEAQARVDEGTGRFLFSDTVVVVVTPR